MNKKKPLTKEQLDDAQRLKSIYVLKKDELRITQDDIAYQLGIGQAAVSHYLNGVNPLNAKTVAFFAKLLKVKPSDISPSIAMELEEIANLMLSVERDDNTTNDHTYNKLTKTEEILLEMFNELPQKEKDNFVKAINTRKNELDQLYEEMKAVKERKDKRVS